MEQASNGIAERQGLTPNIELLAAQRSLYSSAKKIFGIQLCLALGATLVLTVFLILFPALKVWSLLLTLCAILFDTVFLDPKQRGLKACAARIQEAFDCEVLQIPWAEIAIGSKAERETIVSAAAEYRRRNSSYEALHGWYPECASSVPLIFGRIICQRANCWWDAHLRRTYAAALVGLLIVLLMAAIACGIAFHLKVEENILLFISPLLPVLVWVGKEAKRQFEAARRIEELRQAADRLWNSAFASQADSGAAGPRSRELQTEIYHDRMVNPFVFDCFYWLFRYNQQKQMLDAAEMMVNEARKAIQREGVP